MRTARVFVRKVMLFAVVLLTIAGTVHAAEIGERIGREENRTQKIGDQTQQVARELETIVRDLEINQLLTRNENKDFEAARVGMDEIARREIRAVLEQLLAARRALERAKQQDHLRQTIAAQERLITRLTEELVRIQYRSQLRHLLEQMRTIVGDQRQAIGITQTGAIELAATNSDTLRGDILERLAQTQDTVWHDWILVREQVSVMTQRYVDLPFIDTLKQFQSKARELPVDQRLAETRENIKGQRFGLAVAGQRLLSDYFLELLKILQTAGLSPAEQRSALENLIEKTEEAIRQQQDLRAQTETLGRDLTEPLRNEMARAEDQLSNFTKDLAQEAEQVARGEAPQQPQPADAQQSQPSPAQNPKSEIQNPKSEQPGDNPWADQKKQSAPSETREPTSPAAGDLNKAADNMSNAANQLTQAKPREASEAQQAAINNLASALAHLRGQLDANAQEAQADALAETLDQQGEILDQLGQIIRSQEGLKGQTEKAAQAGQQGAKSPKQGQPQQGQEGQQNANGQQATPAEAGQQQPAAAEPGQKPEAQGATQPEGQAAAESAPASPAELSKAQGNLGNETQDFANRAAAATPAAEPLGKAVGEMGEAASELGKSQAGPAVPHQNEALRSLREAERRIAEAMAQALDAQQPMEMLEQMGNLDQIIGQIEQMAGQAEKMAPAPAPEMAQQAENIAQQLGEMAGAAPMGPAMASQIKSGGQMMEGASQQLEQGQTGQAAETMHEAAAALGAVRGEMSAQVGAELAQAQMAAEARQAALGQLAQGQLGQKAAQGARAQGMAKTNQPATQPGRTGKGQGMRGLGPTTYDAKKDLEKDLESGAWSRLPAHEREQVLQALKEKYPARYERALIRYYRNLSRLETEK